MFDIAAFLGMLINLTSFFYCTKPDNVLIYISDDLF